MIQLLRNVNALRRNPEKYVAEHKSGEGGHLFEDGKLTHAVQH